MRAYIAFPLVLIFLACDPVVVSDPFAVAEGESLHVYASHGKVPLTVRANAPWVSVDGARAEGAISLDPDAPPEARDDALAVTLLTGDAGTGMLSILDAGGGVVATRELSVADADDISLSVTAPAKEGIELPAIGDRVRIFSGGVAALRTTVSAGGQEIFGTEMVSATSSDAAVTTRSAVGCAPDTCEAVRAATEIAVTEGFVGEAELALSAGNASIALTVVATPADDITSLVFDEAALPLNTKPGLEGAIVARVLVGDEPVLGAPVIWSIDGETIADDEGNARAGDALEYVTAVIEEHDVVAVIGERQAAARVGGTGFSVTSITAACGASGGAPLWFVLAGIAFTKRRRS